MVRVTGEHISMKLKQLLVAVTVSCTLLASVPAKAAVIVPRNDNAADVGGALGISCDLVLLAKYEWDPNKLGTNEAVWDDGVLGPSYWTVVVNDDGKSGNWAFTGSSDYDLKALAIKGANEFKAVDIAGQLGGDWDTIGLQTNGGTQPAVSHLSFYGCSKSVPEPASLLAGLMALALGLVGRRYWV